MKIIKTKYLSPTNHRGARIKAMVGHYTATIPYDDAFNELPNHFHAVQALLLVNGLDWNIDKLGYGCDDNYYYFTLGRVSA